MSLIEDLTQQVVSLNGSIENLKRQNQQLTEDRDLIRDNFLAHKTETQKRLDELSKVENFSWEGYKKILEEHAEFQKKAPEFVETARLLTEDNNSLKRQLLQAAQALDIERKLTQSLQGIISSHETTIKSLREELEAVTTKPDSDEST